MTPREVEHQTVSEPSRYTFTDANCKEAERPLSTRGQICLRHRYCPAHEERYHFNSLTTCTMKETPVAKRKNGGKSEAIREMLKAKPKAKVKNIVASLAEKQIKVTAGLVYMVKGRMSQIKSHKRKKARRVAAVTNRMGSNHNPV